MPTDMNTYLRDGLYYQPPKESTPMNMFQYEVVLWFAIGFLCVLFLWCYIFLYKARQEYKLF